MGNFHLAQINDFTNGSMMREHVNEVLEVMSDYIVEMMSEYRLDVGDMEDMVVGMETCAPRDDVLRRG